MKSRAEITSRYAKAYVKSGKKEKGQVLDEVVSVTGWSRDNARRRLVAAARPPGAGRQVANRPRRQRSAGYCYDALKVLQRVWAASGGQCGKYLAVSIRTQLDLLERHGELVFRVDRYSPTVRQELLSMSAASIDRYLAPAKATDAIRGASTTKPSPLLRSSIKIRRAGDEVEAEPGFFEGDTVAHRGPTLKGEFARTVNLTDVHTGWVFTRTVRNNAHTHVLAALKAGVEQIPFEVTGLDFDNGTEFLNKAVINRASEMEIFFTRSRPYKKNDQATVESKINHVVRKHAIHWRYDTADELALLNQLWPLVSMRLNFFTPTKKPIEYATCADRRRRRVYDEPKTPWQRVLDAGVLTDEQAAAWAERIVGVNPADLTRRINTIQMRLLNLAQAKTEALSATRHLDLESLRPSINRLAPTK